MTYMLLIYAPNTGRDRSAEEMAEMSKPFIAYTEYLQASGCLIEGAPLAELSSATTVRVRDGKRVITDGPFAETKEFLAGYYTVECPTLDQALELAAKCPAAEWGSMEVRPVIDMSAGVHAG